MAVTVYSSTDASAPTLTGQVGSLTALLDAVLVNGYGTKPAAGWTRAYNGTNKSAYLQAANLARHYFRVEDAASGTVTLAREARIKCYEAMTTIDVGTGPYPTSTTYYYVTKSASVDATARPWVVVADQYTMYMFVKTGQFPGWSGFSFGNYFRLDAAFAMGNLLIGRVTADVLTSIDNLALLSSVGTAVAGHLAPRSWQPGAPIGSVMGLSKHGDGVKGSASGLSGVISYPNGPSAGIVLSQVWLTEPYTTVGHVLGRMRGFWQICHPMGAAINDGDTFSGTGALAGKTFLVLKPDVLGTSYFCLETSNTWETN